MKSWVEISERRLRANFAELRRAAGDDLPVLAVVKADAYGHSAEICAEVLARAGAPWLGVTDAAEGARVRSALERAGMPPGLQPEILMMCGGEPAEAALALEQRLTATVWEPGQIRAMEQAAEQAESFSGRKQAAGSPQDSISVHLEVDSGMSRQGAQPGEPLRAALEALRSARHLRLGGVLTHLASAEVVGAEQTRQQLQSFATALLQVTEAGLRPEWLHVGNTSTVDNRLLLEGEGAGAAEAPLPWLRELALSVGARPMVRAGLALYGYALPLEGPAVGCADVRHRLDPLAPVLEWKTRVRSLREIAPGTAIGYGASEHARRQTQLALLPVGYADGLRRELSGADGRPGGWVVLRGQRAPVAGRVSMNLTAVDVTGVPGVEVGDEVLLLGEDATAEDQARLAGTIPYEILCGLRPEQRRLVDRCTASSSASETGEVPLRSLPSGGSPAEFAPLGNAR